MGLEDSCRLCLGKEGEFYKLFNPSNGDFTLADELNNLLEFKIEKTDGLPDSICTNCFKINSFFKEFRSDCLRVKDVLNRHVESGDTNILGELEKNEEDESKDSVTRNSSTVNHLSNRKACFEDLRANFRDNVVSGVDKVSNDLPRQALEAEGRKQQEENPENTSFTEEGTISNAPLLALVKTEFLSDEDEEDCEQGTDSDNDLSHLNDSTSHLCNSNIERLSNSVSHRRTTSGFDTQDFSNDFSEEIVPPHRKRRRIMMEGNSRRRETLNSPRMMDEVYHKVKEEEIEIFDCLEENEFNNSDEEDVLEGGCTSDQRDCSPSVDPKDIEISSSTSISSDESDEDTEMLLCLALLL